MIKFLAVADLHYCHRKQPGERQNYLSAQKLKKIIKEHSLGCDFIVDFGDTADAQDGCGDQRELMGEIADILKSSSLPLGLVALATGTLMTSNGRLRVLGSSVLPPLLSLMKHTPSSSIRLRK